MSDFDVYEGEMTNNRFSDQDIERFFSGQTPDDEVLARLAVHVGAWHAVYERGPSEEEVTTFAAEAAEIAISMTPTATPQAVTGATVSPFMRLRSALRRKLATGLAAVLLLAGTSGVAVAANDAAPDDTLYGLDQALEAVGILDGGAAERITEAQSLFDKGFVAEAIGHAAEAVAQTDDPESFSPESAKATEALQGAAEAVMADANEESEGVRTAVADLLNQMAGWLENPPSDGATFGENVSSLAKEIAGAPNELPDAADNAADNAAEPAGVADENGEGAGPPEDVPAGPPTDAPSRP